VDSDVWEWLKRNARPLEDTPNSVLRRVAGLDADKSNTTFSVRSSRSGSGRTHQEGHMPQANFREPILVVLHRHNGELPRQQALRELETMLANDLMPEDYSSIESGAVRWQKSAEWQVHAMRRDGLLEAVENSRSGLWKLTSRGKEVAARSISSGTFDVAAP
jgi:hypothetical protein